jgi:thioredoxin reductase (NADPH)
VQGKRLVVIGRNNEAVDYVLAMLSYSPSVIIATNGHEATWDDEHAAWLEEYQVGIEQQRIVHIEHEAGAIQAFIFEQGHRIAADAAFTTRGDVYHTSLAKEIGVELDDEGQILVDACMRTNVSGLYAAGCVTVANCQMIIAAGQGVTAAQAINRDLFKDSLRRHALPVQRRPFENAACPVPMGEEP